MFSAPSYHGQTYANQGTDKKMTMPHTIEEMLAYIGKEHDRSKEDCLALQKRCTELEIMSEVDRKTAATRIAKLTNRFDDATAKLYDYKAANIAQVLDATAGICNVCGSLILEDHKLYVMNGCGAVSSRYTPCFCQYTNHACSPYADLVPKKPAFGAFTIGTWANKTLTECTVKRVRFVMTATQTI